MLQAARRPGLAVKALQQVAAFGDARRDRLDGNGAANKRVASLEDDPHGPTTDLLQDFVSANLLFFSLRHKRLLKVSLLAWRAPFFEAHGEA